MERSVHRAAAPTRRAGVPRTALRVLLGLAGAVKLAGTVWFSFAAAPAEGGIRGPADVAVALWSALLAIAFLVAAVRLGRWTRGTVRVLAVVVALDLVFGLVKLVAYDEPEAIGFLAAGLVILVLVAVVLRQERVVPGALSAEGRAA